MWPEGFLGTRADLLMDIILTVIVIPPFLMWYSFKLIREKKYEYHKKLNIIILSVVFVVVILFEIDVRMTGGFTHLSPYADFFLFKLLLFFHVLVAAVTFLSWMTLGILSVKKYQTALPGAFSKRHKKLGKLIFIGLLITGITGAIIYILVFAV